MAITMQGNWTLRVKTQNAACSQRFIVSGARTGNGTYDGVANNAVLVTGPQWALNIQHRVAGQAWRDSAQRIGLPKVSSGLLSFEIESGSPDGDEFGDGMVLGCSLPASQSDFVVYGKLKTYAGAGLFNPCRDDYIVIDPHFDLNSVCRRYPPLREVIQKLYPDRLNGLRRRSTDGASEATPIVIPTGLPGVAVGLVFQSHAVHEPQPAIDTSVVGKNQLDAQEAAAVRALRTTVKRVPFKSSLLKAGVSRLTPHELQTLVDIRDAAIRVQCDMECAPGLSLRFQEYERSDAEVAGGPYLGLGARKELGLAVTDEQGNYLFRFTRVPADGASAPNGDLFADDESCDAPAPAERPHLIVQVLGDDLAMSFETAPYDNIANLRRIDLCLPHLSVHTCPACMGERDSHSGKEVTGYSTRWTPRVTRGGKLSANAAGTTPAAHSMVAIALT